MNGLGFCLLNQNHAKEAKPYFEKILAKEPDAIGPLNGLARCFKEEGKIDQAIKTGEHGYQIQPEPNDLAGGLADAYLETKQYAKAVPLFELMLKAHPKNKHFQKGLEAAQRGVKEASDKSEK